MSKKKKSKSKVGKGSARAKRATPAPAPSGEALAAFGTKLAGALANAAQKRREAGEPTKLSTGLAAAKAQKIWDVEQAAHNPIDPICEKMDEYGPSHPDARCAVCRNKDKKPEIVQNSASVRTPDAQTIEWTFYNRPPQDAFEFDQDPLATRQSKPARAVWEWYPFDSDLPKVVATRDFLTAKYEVRLEFGSALALKGTSVQAKALAEALLSASDWGGSWRRILGGNTSSPVWADYVRSELEKE